MVLHCILALISTTNKELKSQKSLIKVLQSCLYVVVYKCKEKQVKKKKRL